MPAGVSPTDAHIRDWLKALAALVAASMSGEEISARIGALTPHLAAEFPPPAFCRASLTAVARQCRFFPNFAECCEALAPWWRNHRPLPPAIQHEPIRQRDEPTQDEREHVARVTAETLAALRSSVQPIEDRRRPDTRCLSREQLVDAYRQAGVRPPRCAAAPTP